MKERVEKVIEKLRPSLQADGSNVELVAIEGNKVQLKLTAVADACVDCFLSADMLAPMFESSIKKETNGNVEVTIDDQRNIASI